MQKFILVTMPDGSIWKVPAEMVVVDRAKYYATADAKFGANYDEVFDREYQTAFKDNDEIFDWAANNMDWDDVKSRAKLVPNPEKQMTPAQFQDGWINGDKQIIEEE